MPSSRESSTTSDASADSRLARIAQHLARLSRKLKAAVAIGATASTVAGTFLWIVLCWPVQYRLVPLMAASGTLVLLLGPAAVLSLFYLGLRDLLELPDRIATRTSITVQHSAAVARPIRTESSGVLGRLVRLIRRIWDLRSVLLENRTLIARYGALLRFITPAFLVLVVVAAIISVVLIVLAIGVGLLMLFW